MNRATAASNLAMASTHWAVRRGCSFDSPSSTGSSFSRGPPGRLAELASEFGKFAGNRIERAQHTVPSESVLRAFEMLSWHPRVSFSTYAWLPWQAAVMASIRLTRPTLEVLRVLLAATDDDPAWGLKICDEADLGSGTVYPILDRLSEHGWIEAREETGPHPGRPARRYYELTGTGRASAFQALEEREARRARRFGLAGGTA